MQGNYRWIYLFDPAVELPRFPDDHANAGEVDEESAGEMYGRYLDGAAELPLKSGQAPTVWEFRHLSERERREVQHDAVRSLDHAAYTAVALALVAAIQPDGRFELPRAQDRHGFAKVTDEYMDQLGQVGPNHKGQLINFMFYRIERTLTPPKNS